MSSSIFVQQTGPPSPPLERATVSVHALSSGHFTLPEYQFVHPVSQDARKHVPSLAFLIQHCNIDSGEVTRIVFDLGLRRDTNRYAAPIRKHVATRQPMTTNPDVVKSLEKGGLAPSDIDFVIYSHVHWDHIGEPRDFPDSTFIVGHGSRALLDGTSLSLRGGHSFFEHDLLPRGKTIELSHPSISGSRSQPEPPLEPGKANFSQIWRASGQLPETLDLFNDGSVLIVNAPGHLPGHINLLARVSDNHQVYLAGDACHDRRLLTGEKEIGEWHDAEGHVCCIHADRKQAEETIKRIQELEKNGVEIIFAHDVEWESLPKNKARFFGASATESSNLEMSLTESQQQLKLRFDAEIGADQFDEAWSRLLIHSPEMFAASIRLTSVPKKKGHLAPKIQSLIGIAVAAASTHLHVPNIHRHMRQALQRGASKAEIIEVLCLSSTLGIHACNIGVPILFEVLREAGKELPSGMDGMGKEQWELREDFEKKRGYWHAFWEDFLRLSPEFFGAYVEFSSVPWVNEGGKGVLEPKVKELIYCAFDAAATHLYKPGLKLHMKNVLGYGGTAEEIMEVLELATLLSISTMDVGLEVMEKEMKSAGQAGPAGQA
ncbi:Metallo-hydrolase/oxidoreductase [Polyplosphaeria fusca]|uniref:Metallo-hydrolase/oxidoreductase n=1 Tax=Polyplosphaeria fusca TaxID=682080 RepID=A0A9P4QX88_9PLEO|nr:Metallo-hydrolase/oxidoreductase [Polyplosphaeria fusca]